MEGHLSLWVIHFINISPFCFILFIWSLFYFIVFILFKASLWHDGVSCFDLCNLGMVNVAIRKFLIPISNNELLLRMNKIIK